MLLPLPTAGTIADLAAAVPGDAAMQQVLQRIEAHAHLQLQALERASALVEGEAAPGLAQAYWMIQRQLQWVKQGQIAPPSFRQQSPAWFSQAPGQMAGRTAWLGYTAAGAQPHAACHASYARASAYPWRRGWHPGARRSRPVPTDRGSGTGWAE
jgi:hypothetical protein